MIYVDIKQAYTPVKTMFEKANNIEELLRKLVCECVVLQYVNGCKEKVKIECREH